MKRVSILVTLAILATPAGAHPWGGLAVNHLGDIYFTFVCPPVSETHVACVWLLKKGEDEPKVVLISDSDPSDIILTRDANRTVYAAERVGAEPFRTRLWRFNEDGVPSPLFTFMGPQEFSATPYAIGPDGTVVFYHDGDFRSIAPGEQAEMLFRDATKAPNFDRVDNLTALADGELLVQSGDDLFLLERNGTVRMLAADVRMEDPPRLPFKGANVLFDMTLNSTAEVLLAYYGNREVLRVDADGKTASILQAEGSWSPSGVDQYAGVIFVLESTTPAPAWKFWRQNEIRPRIRSLDRTGRVQILWEY